MRRSVIYRAILRTLPVGLKHPIKMALSRALYGARGGTPRQQRYQVRQEPGLFSFITTVWNTSPAFVQALADSVFAQTGGTHFEWFILDNGSSSQETRECLARIARHPAVRLERVAQNLGIIGGMSYCLERARNRYILPLDSDDYLFPDCVQIFTAVIQEAGYPPLLYSDEDKLDRGTHCDEYFKPDWDPVLFVHSCYIAHLCAIDRKLAIALGAYSDTAAENSHDWDSFMRFMLAGHVPKHVPEIVYSWRKHAQSTAQNIGSKPVVYESQSSVVRKFVAASPRADLYTVEMSPLFGGMPDWWIRRSRKDVPHRLLTLLLHEGAEPIATSVSSNDYPGHEVIPVRLGNARETISQAVAGYRGLVHLFWDGITILESEWAWEALTLMELFPDTVMVGGRIEGPDGAMVAAGSYFGFGRGCDTPERGRITEDRGYFAHMWKTRSVSAVSSQHAVIEAGFLRKVLGSSGIASVPYLGAWAGALAQCDGQRVIYSPFLHGRARADWDDLVDVSERRAFVRAHGNLFPETRFLSRHLGLDAASAYHLTSPEVRQRHLDALRQDAGAENSSFAPAGLADQTACRQD